MKKLSDLLSCAGNGSLSLVGTRRRRVRTARRAVPTFKIVHCFYIACGLFLTGCLSKPALVEKSFAFQTPPVTGSAAGKGTGTLVVPPVKVSPLFANQPLVYRIGPNEYETDPYADFLVPPDESLTIPIRAYLANSGLFSSVVEPDSLIKPDKMLQVYVTELYGDLRDARKPTAVLALRVVFANFDGDAILQKEYSRHLTIEKSTAAAVVAGWNQALGEIMGELAADLTSASKPVEKAPAP